MTSLFVSGLLLAQTILPCHIMAETAWRIANATNIDDAKKVELIQKMTDLGCMNRCHETSSSVYAEI